MGLDSFKTDSSNRGGGRKKKKKKAADHDDSHNAFRIVWNGEHTIPIQDNEIVVQTEEEWQKIINFINAKMGISTNEFEAKPPERRYEIVSNAKDVVENEDRDPFSQTEECDVCGKQYVFPEDWDFVEFDGFISCPTHDVSDVVQEFESQESLVQ